MNGAGWAATIEQVHRWGDCAKAGDGHCHCPVQLAALRAGQPRTCASCLALVPVPARIVARDRDETDSCQAGTPGCCVDHTAEERAGTDDGSCDTW